MLKVLSICFLLLFGFSLHCQTPFTCQGQAWVIEEGTNALLEVTVGTNNGISTNVVNNNVGFQILALGFNKVDRMLYGIHPLTHELYRIDANGNVAIIATPNVDASLAYLAGEVTPDGTTFIIVGSVDGMDMKILEINLISGNYEVDEIPFENGTRTVDIAFHPLTFEIFGFDSEENRFYTTDIGSSTFTPKAPIFFEHDVEGMYFDAFGNMYGLGTAVFGTVSGLFEVDQNTGATTLTATSGIIPIGDMTGCPFSFEMNNEIVPPVAFPCSDLTFIYSFANQTGIPIESALLEHELPIGYSFLPLTDIPFNGVLDNTTPENILRIENITIPTGIFQYEVQAYVDDIPGDIYSSQAIINNIPSEFGNTVLSNDPLSFATEDDTQMEVNRIDEDSLSFAKFVCHGNTIILDASDYGNNLNWSNGATGQQINVSETGLITLTAASGCQELIVNYDVVSASCPYTIEVRHVVEPDTFSGCSEVQFRYILENDSGEERYDLIFLDTLPMGFSFLEIINNPYESTLSPDLPPSVFQLKNLLLKTGIDTIEILVEVGDVSPGNLTNKAEINGLPELIGHNRTSDDPETLAFPDSTHFFVKGVEGGSLEIDSVLCENVILLLDVSSYGDSFLWDDGSTESQLIIAEAGDYHVEIITGCDTAIVRYYITEADPISVNFTEKDYSIHQGESVLLEPFISNNGVSLIIEWEDALTNTLSCLDCPTPIATPLSDIIYSIQVENEYCMDSASIEIFVDETRRIYTPNIFSPNNDGYNDRFYLQSPDPAIALSFQIFDRWGNTVFNNNNIPLNQPHLGWDGHFKGEIVATGVYIWQAEIEFFDGRRETWSGDVMVLF